MRTYRTLLALVLGLILAAPLAAQPALDASSVFRRAAPAIAVIRVSRDSNEGTGTGFVVDPGGLLITASHVARGAERLFVDFGDGPPLDASVLGYDARRDVAMLRVQPRAALPALEIIDSTVVKTGDPVAVIGTPRGRPRVMTTGEVRGVGVSLPGLAPRSFIAFSAEVQPGNSGGPLLNDRAQVVGVVVALARQSDGPVGLATASVAFRGTMPSLAEGARFERAWIGISGATFEPDFRQGRPGARGVVVLTVLPDGPAARAGLRGQNQEPPGDIIVAIDGEPVDDWDDLLSLLGEREPGERVRLGLLREGRYLELAVVLGARP
ncbi:MAG: trypsin-like peptidase domain-containing protein [Armatimonadota bacterium]|nr:trypsin-like peptidase domain-containing protein [Armatimonadota bacterium]